jgi:hypothetical protein
VNWSDTCATVTSVKLLKDTRTSTVYTKCVLAT